MAINTRTYYVAQNITTLAQIRLGAPSHDKFDESSGETVQAAWDAGTPMRCLSGSRHFITKNDLGDSRICFVGPLFFRMLRNANNTQTGNRLDAGQL